MDKTTQQHNVLSIYLVGLVHLWTLRHLFLEILLLVFAAHDGDDDAVKMLAAEVAVGDDEDAVVGDDDEDAVENHVGGGYGEDDEDAVGSADLEDDDVSTQDCDNTPYNMPDPLSQTFALNYFPNYDFTHTH